MSEPGRGGLPPKLYYRIGEVAELVGVEPHVLRYWEREFRGVRPTKSPKGQRVYSRRDVETLLRVRELLYRDGFTIAGARKKLKEAATVLRDGAPPPAAPVTAPEPPPSAPAADCAASPGGEHEALIARMRDELLCIRAEIRSLLAELEGKPGT